MHLMARSAPTLPAGKLAPDLLSRLLARAPGGDPRVVVGPGVGMDCALLDFGDTLLACKTDPITFASDEIGWYAVQVNANDIATTGATPRWFMASVLLPEGAATAGLAEAIAEQIYEACRAIGATVIGGHTEITPGLPRPIVAGTLLGEVTRNRLVTPRGAAPGDRVLITKGAPIEATAILARERPELLRLTFSDDDLARARAFLRAPGISVVADATIAQRAGRVTAMHDPTEGGVLTALWELAEASGRTIRADPSAVPVPPLAAQACAAAGIDPLASIASGALLLTAPATDASAIRRALEGEGIPCADIGAVAEGGPEARDARTGALLARPARDELARLFTARPAGRPARPRSDGR